MSTAAAAPFLPTRRPGSTPNRWSRLWLAPGGRAILGVPLAVKIAGANAMILVAVLAVVIAQGWPARAESLALAASLLVSLAVNAALVLLALQPLRELERTAARVLDGNLDARIAVSPLADTDLTRVSSLLNQLLDSLMEDRERIRRLGARVVSAQDEERASIARELEDSTAQGLAAVMYELRGALDRDPGGKSVAQIEHVAGMAADTLAELRSIARTVYPRILDDLGLMPTLDWLARVTREHHGTCVIVRGMRPGPIVRPAVAAALYRVAQGAIANAIAHGRARRIEITLAHDDHTMTLAIGDDGRGFHSNGGLSAGRGLTAMHERLTLVGGSLNVLSQLGGGTLVEAVAPTNVDA